MSEKSYGTTFPVNSGIQFLHTCPKLPELPSTHARQILTVISIFQRCPSSVGKNEILQLLTKGEVKREHHMLTARRMIGRYKIYGDSDIIERKPPRLMAVPQRVIPSLSNDDRWHKTTVRILHHVRIEVRILLRGQCLRSDHIDIDLPHVVCIISIETLKSSLTYGKDIHSPIEVA